MDLTPDQAITDLETTNAILVEAVNVTKNSIDTRISNAVIVSENAAKIPLIIIARSIIDTQTLLITYNTI